MKNHLSLALRGLVATAVACALPVFAADAPADDDAAALELANETPAQKRDQRAWRLYVEAAAARERLRPGAQDVDGGRAAIDLRYDGRVTPGLRAVFSNRFDAVDSEALDRVRKVNTIREAYLSWQARPDVVADLGRINLRHGAAWGYNPTDYFKGGSLRYVASPDPALLRENRQGTVAAQVQKLWTDTALSMALSPKLESAPSDAPFSWDLGSTNDRNRWLVVASHRFSEKFNPQVLLHGGQDTPTQLGMNLSSLLGSATVGFVELSVGKGPSLAAETLGLAQPKRWQRRAAAGLTYTTAFDLTFTAELDYNSAGLDRQEWDTLRAGAPADLGRLLQGALTRQDLPVQRAAFLYATWRDALVRRLDLSAYVRLDLVTHSREQWLESRYHWDRFDLALQWLANAGDPDTLFGIAPRQRAVELSARFYF